MQQCTTGGPVPQPLQFPKVSHRLLVRVNARRDAVRRGVAPGVAVAAADATYRATHGDRFAARRAGWAAVDSKRGEGRA